MIQGAIVAIVTPFKDGQLDEETYRELIEFQIAGGTHGIVPCGTTGESATLSHHEHKRVVEICIEQVKKRVPVIAGTGSNNTAEAVELTKHAQSAGADAALMITPYYNKPTQEGLYQHYKAIAEATHIPIIVYNVPGRTSLNLLPETVARLAKLPNIIGIKEATGDLNQGARVIRLCPENFIVLSGDDFTALPLMCLGGRGVISVISNVVPDDMAGMCNAFLSGNLGTARSLHYKMWPLMEAMFFETNPVPAKTALKLMGRISGEVRLPLCNMSPANEERLRQVMVNYGLI
ncbi:4-hydroxy-tetrahydrodipicolinate synthase [Desulfobacca acetoxidans]|uniref:4-hydroxy-tetrahydrodipicolinate synthase n=1 Tax=Desulfobacca acetoxidans (strain ATCC 700848 / DSM 11109 / ASRB2) TaxID=880072 RepID=F2NDN4_DESAR|nr:4-hydroxy-tetrahydrodipicolinate synthase [Desulfobacca acetoxidans]AEB10310.1 Dihydrodipicolinate synthase [Desulfobacca acetoxidans DSM 11109]HAY21452.1 4-hydroxy-tetrahydrodipicolinate synthase [Desulfobacterales bacterium]